MNFKSDEKRKIYYALFFPVIISFFVILVFVFEQTMELNFKYGGVFPLDVKTLPNIFTMPFVHSDWEHLLSNIFSFFVLSSTLYYFYSEIASKFLFLSMITSGIILWLIGRETWHIGLSGLVYALSTFLFLSGLIRRHIPLIAISFIVVFLYGNNVWHLFPWQKFDPISWEGHLAGTISGLFFALLYKKRGPQRIEKDWGDEDELELEEGEEPYWNHTEENNEIKQ